MNQQDVLKLVEAGLILIVVKAFLEPAAKHAGQAAYQRLDDLLHRHLPDLFRGKDP